MKEKWTNDLQKKMADYEVPTIPEGLWENIDSALETGVSDKPKEQTTNTQHLTPPPLMGKGERSRIAPISRRFPHRKPLPKKKQKHPLPFHPQKG